MRTNNNAKREMVYTSVSAVIIKETEKAYQAEVLYWTKFDQPTKKAKMWIPKSCSKVQDNKLTEVAQFILNNWEKEHREAVECHSAYAAKRMNIEWDMEHKEALIKAKAEEDAAHKKHLEDIIAKFLPLATDGSHKMLAELGTIAQVFGRIYKENGIEAEPCDKFISWGEKVCKKYGELEPADEYYEKAKTFDADGRRMVLHWPFDCWIFGDFHCNPYGTSDERYFYSYIDYVIQKYFKKEAALIKEYKDLTEVLYVLNGNSY